MCVFVCVSAYIVRMRVCDVRVSVCPCVCVYFVKLTTNGIGQWSAFLVCIVYDTVVISILV